MTPEFEDKINDVWNQASLNEVQPDFDTDSAWQELSGKIPAAKIKRAFPVWAYAASIALAIAIGVMAWPADDDKTTQVAANTPVIEATDTGNLPANASNNTKEPASIVPTAPNRVALAEKKQEPTRNTGNTTSGHIYNGTPCPIEVRINQLMKCPNNQPMAITNSSTLQPDQSTQLHYKEKNNKEKNCSLTIDEIEIKSIATGEVILLNASTTPSMQELFCYLTREKEGNILAGVFNSDCEKNKKKHNLRVDSRDGNLMLE